MNVSSLIKSIRYAKRGDTKHIQKVSSWVMNCDPYELTANDTASVLTYLSKSRCGVGAEKLLRVLPNKNDNTISTIAAALNTIALLKKNMNEQSVSRFVDNLLAKSTKISIKNLEIPTVVILSRASFDLSIFNKVFLTPNSYGETVAGALLTEANHDKSLVKKHPLNVCELTRALAALFEATGEDRYREACSKFFSKNNSILKTIEIPVAASLLNSLQKLNSDSDIHYEICKTLSKLRIHSVTSDVPVSRLLHQLATVQFINNDVLRKLEIVYCARLSMSSLTASHSISQTLWSFNSLQYNPIDLTKKIMKNPIPWMSQFPIRDLITSIQALVDRNNVDSNHRLRVLRTVFPILINRIEDYYGYQKLIVVETPIEKKTVEKHLVESNKTETVLNTLEDFQFDDFTNETDDLSEINSLPWNDLSEMDDEGVSQIENESIPTPVYDDEQHKDDHQNESDLRVILPWDPNSIPKSEQIDNLLKECLDKHNTRLELSSKGNKISATWKLQKSNKPSLQQQSQQVINNEVIKSEIVMYAPLLMNLYGVFCPDTQLVKSLFNKCSNLISTNYTGYSNRHMVLLLRAFSESSVVVKPVLDLISETYRSSAKDNTLSLLDYAFGVLQFQRLGYRDVIPSLITCMEESTDVISESNIGSVLSAYSVCSIYSEIVFSAVADALHDGLWSRMSEAKQTSALNVFTNFSVESKIINLRGIEQEISAIMSSVTSTPKKIALD